MIMIIAALLWAECLDFSSSAIGEERSSIAHGSAGLYDGQAL